MTLDQAATLMGVSTRHTRRIHRDTAKKNMEVESPPMKRSAVKTE